jgi:hypothetical protein
MKRILFFALVTPLFFVACKDDDTRVPAEINQKEILVSGNPTGSFVFYSFDNGALVTATDSASNKWDFAVRFATIIVNSNASGPGNAGVQLKDGLFDSFTEAPETGYAYDTTATKLAVKDDWYTYNPVTRSFAPKAGKVFVFRTATGKYAKLEMLTADPTDDNGNPVVPPVRPTKIKYKFRTGYQRDGSRSF